MLITAPAVRVEQGGKFLFFTRFTVAELISPGFYRVEKLEAGRDKDGYQRELEVRRARRFADYIKDAGRRAFLPTSLFLATGESLDYDAETGQISFQTSDDELRPLFYMVDGQHRAAGLKVAAAARLDGGWVREFPVPTIVAAKMGDTEKMVQFLIVNSTQKKVPKDIEQQILADFSRENGVTEMPYLPKEIRDVIEDSADQKALFLVEYLNESENSPWCGKIRMANNTDKNPKLTAKQSSMVNSLKRSVLKKGHPVALEQDGEKRARMLENFWRATIARCLGENPGTESKNGPLFKTAGIDIFHEASIAVFSYLTRKGRGFTAENFRACFDAADEFVTDECADIFHPDFWKKGGKASLNNRAMTHNYAKALSEAIRQIERADEETDILL